jgi:tetratricopeptide (TPR) repeat protein
MDKKKDEGPGLFFYFLVIAVLIIGVKWYYPKLESKWEDNAGQKSMKKADYQGAIIHFTKAINDDMDNADAYYDRGTAYKLSGLTLTAEADFDSAESLRKDKERKEMEDEQIKENARNVDDNIKGKIKDTGRRLLENWR